MKVDKIYDLLLSFATSEERVGIRQTALNLNKDDTADNEQCYQFACVLLDICARNRHRL